jgi:aryl-phospho-beta-D-glucosidase BglC (GH1 family)
MAINYTVGDNWGSGFIGTMKVPGGSQGLQGWTLEFDAAFDISNIWNAEIVSHVGNHYVVRNAAWNGNVAANGEVSFGFQASGSSTTASAITLNGADDVSPPPPVLPALSVSDASITEGDSGSSQLTFTVTLSKAATGPVSVNYATADGTAAAGSDYTARSGTLTFAAGETSKTISITVAGDTAVEANENFSVVLSGASGATVADGTGAGTIINNDVAPPPPPPPTSGTSLDYDIVSNWGSGFTASMAVGAGSAALNGWTVEFDASFNITNIWNAEIVSHVGNHYVVRNASWNGNVAGGHDTAFGFQATAGSGGTAASGFKINGANAGTDPTPVLPTLAVADTTVAEGDNGTHDLAFTVTLSAASTTPVTVAYATGNGTANAGSDYTAASGTLTFAPGETSKVIHVSVTGDTAVEANETVNLTLSAPNGATIADGAAVGTISNDDAAPLPTLSISDATVTEGNPGAGGGAAAGYFSTAGNQIVDSTGHSVQIAGVNWFGFENTDLAPHGLWTRGYKDMMDQMVDLGFNTIRLPFSNDTLHSTGTPNINLAANPDLAGLSALQVMDKIVDYAGQIGLRIILDHHRNDSGAGTSANGLWYDSQHSEAQWISDWQMLAGRYAGNPTVIGADLHNEPFAGTWGGGGPTDWAAAAERAGNAIGTVNPNWLIFVEGVADYKGQSYWWGGNLMGVRDRPIDLNVDNKLVYSAHDYPNSVWAQPWFAGDNFAAGLPAKFDQMWGYIYEDGIAPVYIGEFGTNLTDPKDAPWLKAITSYMGGDLDNNGTHDIPAGKTGVSWTFWSWNPNSGDTGGILQNDWRTVNTNKMAYLTPIEFDLGGVPGGGGGTTPTATFALTLSAPATGTVTVHYHTEGGTAGSADFVSQTGTVTFAAGEQTRNIAIAITPDTTHEANETFSVVLTDATGAVIGRSIGIGTIVDDDTATPPPALPSLSVADATTAEGNSGTHDLLFTVVLSAAATTAVTVAYATGNGSATAGSDFAATTGTLTFAPGETSKVVHIAVTGDTAVESNETLTLTLSSAVGAVIADGSATGTITNDDTAPPPPPSSSDLHAAFSLTDSWSSGFNGNVVVHNDGSSTTGWQIVINTPYQINDIWNAKILSHDANGYVVGPAAWNGTLAHDGETSFGFTASGAFNAANIHFHGIDGGTDTSGSPTTPPSTPTVPATPHDGPMFSPYIDMAMAQDADLLAISHASGIENFTLAFVLASNEGIGWQGVGGIDDDSLSNGSTIRDQVNAIHAAGGSVTISFGGAAGNEAALMAHSATELQAQYQSVIDRYGVNSIDFDIEGSALPNASANAIRDQAIAGLQAANPDLKVSFTLPVLPTGLTQDGLNLLQGAMNHGVRIDMVNIMAMDYGASVDNNGQMGLSAIQASESTQQQLASLGLNTKIGITPMIGVNDIASEVFKLSDAQALVDYAAHDADVAMLSMWSVARDNSNSAGAHYASPDSSGIAQDPYAFAKIFHAYDVHS